MSTTPEFDEYLKLVWSGWSQGIGQAQKQLLSWLFTLHAGGIAGTLGYAHSSGIRCGVIVALVAFVLGIILVLVWGTLMYYFNVACFKAMKRDVQAVESEKVSMQDFVTAEDGRQDRFRLCEIVAWISGASALIGLLGLIFAVLKT